MFQGHSRALQACLEVPNPALTENPTEASSFTPL